MVGLTLKIFRLYFYHYYQIITECVLSPLQSIIKMTTDIFLSPMHLNVLQMINVANEDDQDESEETGDAYEPNEDEDGGDGLLHDINDDQKFKDEDDLIDIDLTEEEDKEFTEEEVDNNEDDYGDGRER